GEAGHQRVLDHVAGEARVLADQDAVTMLAAMEQQTGGLADLQRQLGREHAVVGLAANAVRPEILANHSLVPRRIVPTAGMAPAGRRYYGRQPEMPSKNVSIG